MKRFQKKINRVNVFNCSLFIVFMSLTSNVFSQTPPLTPGALEMLRNMSPAQQQALLGEYDIDGQLTDIGSSQDINSSFGDLGKEAEIIQPIVKRDEYRRKIAEEKEINKFESQMRGMIPVFERNYSDLNNQPLFGRFLFDADVTTYAPVDNITVPESYRLGAGDSLMIITYGNENSASNLVINRRGYIDFPRLGSLPIAGLTYSEASELIKERVSSQLIGTKVDISMGDLKSINVIMAGEVKVPGMYSVSSLATVTQMLFIAGGVSEIGSLRNIQVKRRGEVVQSFDAYEILINGNLSQDIRLQSGDTVLVNILKNIAIIDGELRRPGKYEFKSGDTINELIQLAGGTTSRAYERNSTLERYNQRNTTPDIININLLEPVNKMRELKDGDILRIAGKSNRINNKVILKGAYERPGHYGWYEGMTFSSLISNIDSDLIDDADLKRSLIVRRKSDQNSEIKVLGFDVSLALNNPNSDFDPLLNVHDEVIIFKENDQNTDTLESLSRKASDISNLSIPQIESLSTSDTNSDESETNNQNQSGDNDNKKIDPMALNENIKSKYSRSILLPPILNKLRIQSNNESPVSIVSVSGAVRYPGEYPLEDGAKISDLINIAGGLTDDALIERAELRRIVTNNNLPASIEFLTVNIKDQLKEIDGELLFSRDHLRVNSIKNWNPTDTIEIQGEVFYPGNYLIRPNETLSSVIKRAGGITDQAFPEGSVFTRESVKDKEKEQLTILANSIRREIAAKTMTKESQELSLGSDQVEAGIATLLEMEVGGRLIIDLPALLIGNDLSDIRVMNGDVLNVPRSSNVVTVVGEVRKPGSFVRQAGYSIEDYAELAAGMTQRADKKQIYVIRSNGAIEKEANWRSNMFEFNSEASNEIRPGDTIVVPIKTTYQTPLNYYTSITQIIFQSITSIAGIGALLAN